MLMLRRQNEHSQPKTEPHTTRRSVRVLDLVPDIVIVKLKKYAHMGRSWENVKTGNMFRDCDVIRGQVLSQRSERIARFFDPSS